LADHNWIGLTIFNNFANQDWIGFNFIGSGWTRTEKFHSPLISGGQYMTNTRQLMKSGKCNFKTAALINNKMFLHQNIQGNADLRT